MRNRLALLVVMAWACDTTKDDPDPVVDPPAPIDTENSPVDTDSVAPSDPFPCDRVSFSSPAEPSFRAGPQWGDWVSSSMSSQACELDETWCDACWHGGEFRTIVVEANCECDQIEIRDSLGVFDWSCSAPGGGVLELNTQGLRAGKGLADLLDPAALAWRELQVEVSFRDEVARSDPGTWWTNPVYEMPADGQLAERGAVYLAPADGTGNLTVTANSVSVVVPRGMVWSGGDSGGAAVEVSDKRFPWIEGTFDASNQATGVSLSADGATLRRLELFGPEDASEAPRLGVDVQGALGLHIEESAVHGADTALHLTESPGACVRGLEVSSPRLRGLVVSNSPDVALTSINVAGSAQTALAIEASPRVFTQDVTLADAQHTGLSAEDSPDLIVQSARVFNSGSTGVHVGLGADRARLSQLLIANGDGDGLHIEATNTTTTRATVVAHGQRGVRIEGHGAVLSNVVSAHHREHGFSVSASQVTLVDVAAAHNGGHGVYAEGPEVSLQGELLLGQQGLADCSDDSPSNGLADQCDTAGGQDPHVVLDVTLDASFVGPVSDDDSANTSDSDGQAPYAADLDWWSFDTPARVWWLDVSAPSLDAARACTDSDTCRIWDWGLWETDGVLLNRLEPPDGDDTHVHRWFAETQVDCDTIEDAVWNTGSCQSTFLRHAAESLDDAYGNNNGLCESSESCVYHPNIGVYQGHGPLRRGTTPADGTLESITMREHRRNGRPLP